MLSFTFDPFTTYNDFTAFDVLVVSDSLTYRFIQNKIFYIW